MYDKIRISRFLTEVHEKPKYDGTKSCKSADDVRKDPIFKEILVLNLKSRKCGDFQIKYTPIFLYQFILKYYVSIAVIFLNLKTHMHTALVDDTPNPQSQIIAVCGTVCKLKRKEFIFSNMFHNQVHILKKMIVRKPHCQDL